MSGRCRGCGAEGVPLVPTLIAEDTTSNKLALLDLCAACRMKRGRVA